MKRKDFSNHQPIKRPKLESTMGSTLSFTEIKSLLDEKGESIFNRLKRPARSYKDYLRTQVNPPPSDLHIAILNEDLVRINAILDSKVAPLHDCKESHDSPLHWACAIGNPEVINLLIKSGANPQLVNRLGMTPMACTMLSNNPAAMDTVLAHGIALPIAGFGELALHYIYSALDYGATDCLRHLFKIILAGENQDLALRYMVLLWVAGMSEFYSYIPTTMLCPLVEEMLGNYNVLMRYVVKYAHHDFPVVISRCRQHIQKSVLRNCGEHKQSLAHWGAVNNNVAVLSFCQENEPGLLTMCDDKGLPPLAWAVRSDCVIATLFLGPRWHSFPVGHYAVKSKAIAILRALAQMAGQGSHWEQGVLTAVDKSGDSPLICAGRAGNIQLFKAIVDGFPQALDWRGENGETVIERLIENESTREDASTLDIEEREEKYGPFFKDLLEFYPGIWEEKPRPGAYPPIALAAQRGSVYILESLFRQNPNSIDWIDFKSQERLTHLGAKNHRLEVLDFFLLNRPELLIVEDSQGQTPLWAGATEAHDVMEWYCDPDNFKGFIELALPDKVKNRLPYFQNKGWEISKEEEQELLIALKDNLPHLKRSSEGETALSLAVKHNYFVEIDSYATLASIPKGLSSPFQRALASAFASAFECRDAKGNNLLYLIADRGHSGGDSERNEIESLYGVLDEETEAAEQKKFNEQNTLQIHQLEAIETILDWAPDSLSQQNKLGKTPAQMITSPLFFAYLKVARRSQFGNLPEPDCMRPKKQNGRPYGPPIFRSLYDWAIQEYLSIYFYLRYSPFFRGCSINIDGVSKIVLGYIAWRPLHFIFLKVLFNDHKETGKSKTLSLLLDEGIRTLYGDRYVALPECKTLISDAKTSEIAEAVENHDYEVRIAALRREWRQRPQEVPDSLSLATSSVRLNLE